MNQRCRVCGEPAAGFHFGAFTCEGCKSFFGRTYNNVSSLGECKNGGRCVITKKNRTACKACRLRKCLLVGMSKSGSRYGRRSNWFKIHCLLQEQVSLTEPTSPSSLAVQEAKRALQGLASQGLTSPSPSPAQDTVRKAAEGEEDAQVSLKEERESPALSSPESQASDNSLESPLDPRMPFRLYPKLGALSPFFLHAGTPLGAPSTPYSRLPIYPYLYPMLGRPSDNASTSSSSSTSSPCSSSSMSSASSPVISHLRDIAHLPGASTSHLSLTITPAHAHRGPPINSPLLLQTAPHPAHVNRPTSDRRDDEENNNIEDLSKKQESSRSPPCLPPPGDVDDVARPASPRCGDEADEQKEPIDLSVKRHSPPPSSAADDAPLTKVSTPADAQVLSYSMKVTTASLSPGKPQENSTTPVDLSCRA